MGPRPFERGNPKPHISARPAVTHFNGAAPFRARKLAYISRNGAFHDVLQWGRALSSAEIESSAMAGVITGYFNGAAPFRARKYVVVRDAQGRVVALQWGRALSSAEIFSPWLPPRCRSLLQWGRALSSAEIGHRRIAQCRVYATSMGPRPFERGNSARLLLRSDTSALQWGRALSSAEILYWL